MSFKSNAVALGSTSSLPHEILETGSDNYEEYVPLLTSRQHYLDNQNSEYEDENEENKIDTGSIRKKKCKSAKAIQQELLHLHLILNCSFIHDNLIGHPFGCQHILTILAHKIILGSRN